MRRALEEMGRGAKPPDIRDHIRQRHGRDIDPDLISTYRGELARRGEARKGPGKTPAVKKPAAPAARPPARPAAGTGAVGLEDLRVVKDLLGRYGADALRDLIDLLAR